jgi:hypothetical protein
MVASVGQYELQKRYFLQVVLLAQDHKQVDFQRFLASSRIAFMQRFKYGCTD